ncbi:hypothetical protein QKU48_gp0756 [Fadolivirus algeromassiliense]|jgi:hypothetical protein|uniref:Uncharacterized protein n=1 Tax=Fadolivirus FV1/VV64 TaxID=3070911 RepID=A0A7D3UVP7_9VIRU|nr:hypothetical protein QKU48_gp0756 [Fadolivirus algeromassiliense]QKF94214.1 hypothetical protein Fadolivirus_1_756 [Fadolivirus FV1/VV64]
MDGFTETTPLLEKLNKNIIECGTIIIEPNKYHHETVEIITNNYTCDSKFIITCTNCNRFVNLGISVNGTILKIYKKNIRLECKINWFMVKC